MVTFTTLLYKGCGHRTVVHHPENNPPEVAELLPGESVTCRECRHPTVIDRRVRLNWKSHKGG